ncbi:UPF0158 family protein [Virgibacillus byunsanensis]|uniref:UPF0158 family protein n=1 Tax=Virgibacillus byunsanensis TaxID=570945 RepID=A0ABW3LHC2_9BACI
MSPKVKLEDILEGMELQSEESTTLCNLKTGEIVNVLNEFLWKAEGEVDFGGLPDWQQEQMKLAYDILEHEENYTELPTDFDIHEYSMIEDFCYTVKDPKAQEILLKAIHGKGAFRRFKENAFNLELEQDWYSYRDACYKQIAIEFCERNNMEYVE